MLIAFELLKLFWIFEKSEASVADGMRHSESTKQKRPDQSCQVKRVAMFLLDFLGPVVDPPNDLTWSGTRRHGCTKCRAQGNSGNHRAAFSETQLAQTLCQSPGRRLASVLRRQ